MSLTIIYLFIFKIQKKKRLMLMLFAVSVMKLEIYQFLMAELPMKLLAITSLESQSNGY
jgi:hypothetical protein